MVIKTHLIKTLSITFVFLIGCNIGTVHAQKRKIRKDKVKALMVAHITEELDLSAKEAEKFWPIYNQYTKNRDNIINTYNKIRATNYRDQESLTEDASKTLIAAILKMEKDRYELRAKLVSDLQKVISYQKIATLVKAQESFKRKLFRKYKDYHNNRGKTKTKIP